MRIDRLKSQAKTFGVRAMWAFSIGSAVISFLENVEKFRNSDVYGVQTWKLK